MNLSSQVAMNFIPQREAPVMPRPPQDGASGLENVVPASQQLNDAHPLEARVTGWHATQDAFHLELLRQTQGSAEPIRRVMERKIVDETTYVPQVLGGSSNVHQEILRNTDASLDWDDVYPEHQGNELTFHAELEKRMRI